ncbi:endosomal/lysosomal proton channel TMEM175-like [Montipora foliosa]|uniref:endosomal/lysosomal proton channel TMEM175-like n=1 Tax=Montipora foliosa TaxID=591990 RepID=UPI0035F1A00A
MSSFQVMEEERDFVHLNRLKCFNDAVFAIVSTILILPIRRLEEKSDSDLEELLKDRWVQLVVYFMSFLVICSVWESHVHRLKILAHVDDVLIWLNLASLMFTSFLPFGCALEGKYPKKYLPIVLICCNMLIIEGLEVVMILYSFRRHHLLKEQLQELPEEQLKERRNYMLVKKLINPLMYLLSASFSNTSSVTSWVLISVVIFTPCIHRFLGIMFRKCKAIRMGEADFDLMFGNYIDTERVECFSDGVFSIVATLLVLDITTENFPKEQDVDQDGIDKTVLKMWPKFLIYIATFVIIALLWFLHHSLFHGIRKMNQIMLVANNISLSFTGFFPFIVALMNKFVSDPNHLDSDTRVAVRCGAVITCIASIAQAVIFVVAVCHGHSHLEPKANPAVSRGSHLYLALKLTIIPLVSLFVYFTTFAGYSVLYLAFYAAILITPFLFLALKIVLGQRDIGVMRRDIVIDPETDTWVPPPHRSRLRVQRKALGETSLSDTLAV